MQRDFTVIEFAVIASCIFTALLLLLGIRVAKPGLLLPHMIWQALFIVECISSALFLAWLTYSNQLLRPAAVVLIVMIAIPSILIQGTLALLNPKRRF